MMLLKTDSYDSEFLSRVKEMGSSLTPVPEMAALLHLPEDSLEMAVQTVGHPIRIAYVEGLAATNLELRKTAIESASAGSPAAMEQCLKFAQNIRV